MAEASVPLLGACWAAGSMRQGADPVTGVFDVLLVSTASLILFGELVIGAYRRARYRNAVLAHARQQIIRSVLDDPP